jgi:hypothetical protein
MSPQGAPEPANRQALPPIPAKRYFTIGEVSELCAVKPHVLRYWEQEFTQLRPVKRSGNRRYYQHHEVLLVRRIRNLLYDQGFTIQGARNRLDILGGAAALRRAVLEDSLEIEAGPGTGVSGVPDPDPAAGAPATGLQTAVLPDGLRAELMAIRRLLRGEPDPD